MARILKVSVTKLAPIENLWQVWYNGKQRKALVVFQYGNEAFHLPPKQFTRAGEITRAGGRIVWARRYIYIQRNQVFQVKESVYPPDRVSGQSNLSVEHQKPGF